MRQATAPAVTGRGSRSGRIQVEGGSAVAAEVVEFFEVFRRVSGCRQHPQAICFGPTIAGILLFVCAENYEVIASQMVYVLDIVFSVSIKTVVMDDEVGLRVALIIRHGDTTPCKLPGISSSWEGLVGSEGLEARNAVTVQTCSMQRFKSL